MTAETVPLKEAAERHDVTLALTPGQILLIFAGLFLVLRLLGRIRERQLTVASRRNARRGGLLGRFR